jgi:hypothetical protein
MHMPPECLPEFGMILQALEQGIEIRQRRGFVAHVSAPQSLFSFQFTP